MWTKAEIAKLTIEQREVLARFESRYESRKMWPREELLKEVRGRRSWNSIFMFVSIFAICLIVLFNSDDQSLKHFAIFAVFALTIVSSLIQIEADRTDRRMNALLELLELDRKTLMKMLDLDRKTKDDSNNSKDEKIG